MGRGRVKRGKGERGQVWSVPAPRGCGCHIGWRGKGSCSITRWSSGRRGESTSGDDRDRRGGGAIVVIIIVDLTYFLCWRVVQAVGVTVGGFSHTSGSSLFVGEVDKIVGWYVGTDRSSSNLCVATPFF